MQMREIINLCEAHPASITQRTYWHGTQEQYRADSIIKRGLDPDETIVKYTTTRLNPNSAARPIPGHVYITPDLHHALPYAGYGGFMFEFPGDRLGEDIQPDEDTLGELVGEAYEVVKTAKPSSMIDAALAAKLLKIARSVASSRDILQCADGHTGYYTKVGKLMLAVLPPVMKVELAALHGNVAHRGALRPARCWQVPQRDAAHKDIWFCPPDYFMSDKTLYWSE